MEYEAVRAELTATEELPGLGSALGRLDSLLVRDGSHWVVARDGERVGAGRVSGDPGRVFEARYDWPLPGTERVYVSPVPGGGLAVSGGGSVALHEADGSVRWTFPHPAWPSGTHGACAPDPSGTALLAVVRPALDTDPTEVLLNLDLVTGAVLASTELPTRWGTYEFQQPLGPAAAREVLLNAAQGQEEAYSLLVAAGRERLALTRVGGFDEPFTGDTLPSGAFLTLAVAGEQLTRYDAPDRPRTVAKAAEVLADDLVFMGRPGFLDGERVLTAAGEDPWEEECRHLLLDATDLRPRAEITYPPGAAVTSRTLPLGDGTWLTFAEDTIQRWRTV
ncbi:MULTISPECIES: hypothetical protein [unclassified Streptomyces]|uniref:hypothetical protein n=1 Tax=unclassified Streptomyces TaxID=2593676 RepID=UPI0006F8A7C3|nr:MULTISPECIES: hypothetical protein [unclassified Streptomyces]KQX51007.1 hypothetical protein ASD33_13495 [Streptomyces sp. Root1304]KRA85173.1 hypothetical protein ASE09_13500 [Streptomyces sp. Root66D1]